MAFLTVVQLPSNGIQAGPRGITQQHLHWIYGHQTAYKQTYGAQPMFQQFTEAASPRSNIPSHQRPRIPIKGVMPWNGSFQNAHAKSDPCTLLPQSLLWPPASFNCLWNGLSGWRKHRYRVLIKLDRPNNAPFAVALILVCAFSRVHPSHEVPFDYAHRVYILLALLLTNESCQARHLYLSHTPLE